MSADLTYTRATPTFHHWQTGGCSYGLAFQIAFEANTFAKEVADIGKKLAYSGLGFVNAASYGSGADNYDSSAGGGSYVRLAVAATPPFTVDPVDRTSLHDYSYPSIDTIVPAPTVDRESICHMEPHHSLPSFPMTVRHDCSPERQSTCLFHFTMYI